MGYTTDFIGHVDISPPLNEAESLYLTAFSASRRFDRPQGPYFVPGNPQAEEQHADPDLDRYNATGHGQPGLWCDWVPCLDGCCLSFSGVEKFYDPVEWLRYLIQHFLKPGARAARSGLEEFESFTFDHRLDGMIVGCRRDTRELFAITATNNRVTRKLLRAGDAFADFPPFPYEQEIDRWREERQRRLRGTATEPDPDNVVQLGAGWMP